MNDALHSIERDAEFGSKLARATADCFAGGSDLVCVGSGPNVNAAYVVGSHHADELRAYLVGGNTARRLGAKSFISYTTDLESALRELARSMGYELRRANM